MSRSRSCRVTATGLLVLVLAAAGCAPMPQVNLEADQELVTSEAGDSVDVSVSLWQRPRGVVTVRAISSDEGEGRASAPVRFDADNWAVPQTITLRGVDDSLDDGDARYRVTFEASASWQRRQAPVVVDVLELVNVDDENALFSGLGDLPGGAIASYAADVDDSGAVVVGWSSAESGDQAVRWNAANGLAALGGEASQAQGVSPDGTVIVGSVAQASYLTMRAAAVWRGSAPLEILPPALANETPLFFPVAGTVALDDGRVFGTCLQANAYGDRLMCVVDAAGALDTLGPGRVLAADDQDHLVGVTYPDPHAAGLIGSLAVQRNLLSYSLEYPAGASCVRPHQCRSEAHAYSLDPVTVVGTSRVPALGQSSTGDAPLFDTAFVATEGEGMLRLPDLPGGEEASGAHAIDTSGRVIAGFGTNEYGKRAVVWVDRVPRLLAEIIGEADGNVPAGWVLHEITAMSADGLTLVGNATNPDANPEAFRVTLPSLDL